MKLKGLLVMLFAGFAAGAVALDASAQVPGDPSAVSNEVIDVRWTKNTYANGDITMSDRETGLMWLHNASLGGKKDWDSAVSYCGSLIYAGYSDWRLPSKSELAAQFHSKAHFTGVIDYYYYWAGTFRPYSTDAWGVSMGNGGVYDSEKTYAFHVWPVRGGQ
ncbi:MAG: DUF1566 domain-containing protein [Kiritimatiellaceae bacterium]|nr:DUF1566 domain-containing protein [Kiritimatiellaceae bacterium]